MTASRRLRRSGRSWYRRLIEHLLPATLCLPFGPVALAEQVAVAPPDQAAEYRADVPKTIIELQQFRRSDTIATEGAGNRHGTATLIDLNPDINAWFLLTLDWGDGGGRASYHLENPDPRGQRLSLAGSEPHGILITTGSGNLACDLWSGDPTPLQQARNSSLPYAPLCGERLYLRNQVAGHQTDLERVTDFLRDHVWSGEAIVGFVRDNFYRDAFIEKAAPGAAREPAPEPAGAPAPAPLSADYADRAVTPEDLGIAVTGSASGQLALGRWYPVSGLPGIYLSVIQPEAIAKEILDSYPNKASHLDAVEASALDYLVAFDLGAFDLGFILGTDHPRVGWSPRPPDAVREDRLPGPDGIGTAAPLITTGMVSPLLVGRTVAAFTGGFKREHGAFRYGDLADRNRGSHYGFIEAGVVFSKLQPGLATLYRLDDGTVHMGTWSEADDHLLARIEFARQNGVPLIEPDPATGAPAPGPLVARWGAGNWSGSAEEKLRTLRAGACLLDAAGRHFLVYGWFSTATPSAMARVFQAYGCRYAMQLDINALEHTYLALYVRKGDQVVVEHLIHGMEEVDKTTDGQMIPRFIGFADNRDFFYLYRPEDQR
jgi:hypothetical protein